MTKSEIKELRVSLISQQSEMMHDINRHGVSAGVNAELIAD